jgi:hypothetical protein
VPQYIETIGEIRPRMLPVKRVPVAGRGRFPGHQVTERRPMVDGPIAGLQDNQAHGSTLVFQYTALADQREQVIANRQRAVVARRCKPQADVRNLPVAMWPLQALPTSSLEMPSFSQRVRLRCDGSRPSRWRKFRGLGGSYAACGVSARRLSLRIISAACSSAVRAADNIST